MQVNMTDIMPVEGLRHDFTINRTNITLKKKIKVNRPPKYSIHGSLLGKEEARYYGSLCVSIPELTLKYFRFEMAGPFLSLLRRNTTLIRPGLLAQATVYGANVVGLSYYLKNSLLLKYSKKYSERHGVYGPEEPDEELNNMLNEIITKDLKEMASENTPIALYLTPGMETTHLGTVGTLTGGFVGIPYFYEFKNEDDAKDNILIRYVSDDTETNEEKEPVDCFLLSNKAKQYGIAREVLLINSLQVYINAFLPFAISMVVVMICKEMYGPYHILKKPLYMRGLIYTAMILAGFHIWRNVYKNVLQYYESEVEAKIVQLGIDYIEGGIEYCTKELRRNSLPVEIKNEKLRIFKAIDDFFSKLLPSGTPLSVRLEYLIQQKEQQK